MNYNHKKFRPVTLSNNSALTSETIFEYHQEDNIITCNYKGGDIIKGHLIGLVDKTGNIDMRYHQANKKGELMTGTCASVPEIMANGKIRLHETWQWTSGDKSSGTSILEEL